MPGFVDISMPAIQAGARVGTVMLRSVTEPVKRRYARYGGLVLLVTMGALVIAVLSFSQNALARCAQQLSQVNIRPQEEMEECRKTERSPWKCLRMRVWEFSRPATVSKPWKC